MEQLPIEKEKKSFSLLQVLGIAALAVVIAIITTLLILKSYFMPSPFKPVVLSQKESTSLEQKLERLDGISPATVQHKEQPAKQTTQPINPEPYSESEADRTVQFNERELNSL